MATFGSLEEMYRSLFQQCVEIPKRNKDMELSIFQNLFHDERYDLILEGLKKGLKLTLKIQEMILESGDLKLYQYLNSQNLIQLYLEFFPSTIFTSAIKSGKLETVIWLNEIAPTDPEELMKIAIRRNQLVIAKWLYSRGCPLPETAWNILVLYSATQDMFDWLLEIKYPFNHGICYNCAYEGKLGLLQWFRAQGCPWFRIVCSRIAEFRGHHHIVEWIESQPD